MVLLLNWFFLFYCCVSINYPSTGCKSSSQRAPNNSTMTYSMSHNNIERSYVVHIPINYEQQSLIGQPVILALHGYNGTAMSYADWFGMQPFSNQYNFLAVYPQGSYNTQFNKSSSFYASSWNDLSCSGSPGPDGPTCNVLNTERYPLSENCRDPDGNNCNWCTCNADDVSFIGALLTELENIYCIDISREYALGSSNGATMTHQLGCSLNNRLAAVSTYNGQLAIGFNCKPKYNVSMPIMLVWGTQDDIEPGVNVIAYNGFYCLSVYGVMYKFAMHNKCDINGYKNIETVSDGIYDWKCVEYNQNCDNNSHVRSCSWDGKHQTPWYHNYNFGLNVTWQFFNQYQRIPF